MKPTAAKIVPKLLNFEQKQCRMDIGQETLTTFNDDPDLLKKVITGDESWSPIIPMEASRNADKSSSSSVKFEDFSHCVFRLECRGASLILATRSYGQ